MHLQTINNGICIAFSLAYCALFVCSRALADDIPAHIDLKIDHHPLFIQHQDNIAQWQEPGKIFPSASDDVDISIKSDDGLLGTRMQDRYTFSAPPEEILEVCGYVGKAHPRDPSEIYFPGQRWISILRKGTRLYLSDGVTNHYCFVWSIDFDTQTVSILDRWPHKFFLSSGLNIAGVSSSKSTLSDGRVIHTISLAELQRVCLGFIQILHIGDFEAIQNLHPSFKTEPQFTMSWGLSLLASLNAASMPFGMRSLVLARSMCGPQHDQLRDTIEQNLNAALLRIDDAGSPPNERCFHYKNYGRVSLPLLLNTLDTLTKDCPPDSVSQSLETFRRVWPSRMEADVFMARSLLSVGQYDQAIMLCQASENRISTVLKDVIHVEEDKIISRLLELKRKTPGLDYFCDIIRKLRHISSRSYLRSQQIPTAQQIALENATRNPEHAESFFVLSEVAEAMGNRADQFGYLIVAYKKVKIVEDLKRVKSLIQQLVLRHGRSSLLNLLGGGDRNMASEVLDEIFSATADSSPSQSFSPATNEIPFRIAYKGSDGVSLRNQPNGNHVFATVYNAPGVNLLADPNSAVEVAGMKWIKVKVVGWLPARNIKTNDKNLAVSADGVSTISWSGGGNPNDNFLALRTSASGGARIAKVYSDTPVVTGKTVIGSTHEWVSSNVIGWMAEVGPGGSLLIERYRE